MALKLPSHSLTLNASAVYAIHLSVCNNHALTEHFASLVASQDNGQQAGVAIVHGRLLVPPPRSS